MKPKSRAVKILAKSYLPRPRGPGLRREADRLAGHGVDLRGHEPDLAREHQDPGRLIGGRRRAGPGPSGRSCTRGLGRSRSADLDRPMARAVMACCCGRCFWQRRTLPRLLPLPVAGGRPGGDLGCAAWQRSASASMASAASAAGSFAAWRSLRRARSISSSSTTSPTSRRSPTCSATTPCTGAIPGKVEVHGRRARDRRPARQDHRREGSRRDQVEGPRRRRRDRVDRPVRRQGGRRQAPRRPARRR